MRRGEKLVARITDAMCNRDAIATHNATRGKLVPLTDRLLLDRSIATTHPDLHQTRRGVAYPRKPGCESSAHYVAVGAQLRNSSRNGRLFLSRHRRHGRRSRHLKKPFTCGRNPARDVCELTSESRADSSEERRAGSNRYSLAGARERAGSSLHGRGRDEAPALAFAAKTSSRFRGNNIPFTMIYSPENFDVDDTLLWKITVKPCFPSCRARKLSRSERERGTEGGRGRTTIERKKRESCIGG